MTYIVIKHYHPKRESFEVEPRHTTLHQDDKSKYEENQDSSPSGSDKQ